MPTVEELRQRLGFDPSELRSFRTSVTLRQQPTIAGLASTIDEQLARINASPYVKEPLKADDVYVHAIEACSTRYIADRSAFVGISTLRRGVASCQDGIAMLTRHATGGGFFGGSNGENAYGRTFAAQLEQSGDVTRALVQFYMLREHSPNGDTAPSTDDLDKGLKGGTLFDVSAGMCRTGEEYLKCDVCEQKLFDMNCRHFPGTTENMSAEQIAAQHARGVPRGTASFTFENFSFKEISFVYDGAVPGAGTALSTATPPVTPAKPASAPVREEEGMYSKELKIKLGLSADATDAEVEARLAQLNAAGSRADTAEAALKAQADAAFVEKYKGKLSDALIEQLKGLADRDKIAAQMLAEKTPAPVVAPPVGDPLKGTALQSPKSTEPGAQPTPEETFWREGLAVFDTPEKLNTAVLVEPMAALGKVLGTKLHLTAMHRDMDKAAVATRKQLFGI